MFKRILVAVDGSPASNAGLAAAVGFASDQRATLIALHVIDDGALPVDFEGAASSPSAVDAYFEALHKAGRKLLDKVAKTALTSGLKCESQLVRSRGRTVAQVVVAQARKLRADVIVIGTHGRRGLRRLLLGSDAESVVREATVPVLLVRVRERATRKPKAKPARGRGKVSVSVMRPAP
ncbi:MAG: universal stress protein [Burkholderiales bacterium]|nr:universal stress protein [Burkholderiales bacterium]